MIKLKTKLSTRLTTLRLKHNLTQKELADALNIDLNTIISWENDELTPSIDELIKISNYYNISLDDLVENEPTINIGKDEIHITDDEDEVRISFKEGIHINTKNKEEKKHIVVENPESQIISILTSVYILLVIVAFLVLGFISSSTWSVCWTLFLTIPVFDSLIRTIKYKRLKKFNITCLILFVYLSLGMLTSIYPDTFNFSWWHPGWVIFFFIPIWYQLIKLQKPKQNE